MKWDVVRTLLAGVLVGLSVPIVSAGEGAKTTLTITGMTCGGCATAVKIQLKRTEGVTSYDVSYEKGEAEVSYDPAKTTPEKIAESVAKTGFKASVKGKDKAKRPATSAQEAEAKGLLSLSDGILPLASGFNSAKGRARFLAVLSPACGACVHGAEAIKAAILPASQAIDVFVVWTPMLEGDGGPTASARSAILAAPHVRQYWDPSRRVGASFRNDVFPDAVERMKRSLPEEHFFEQYLVERDDTQPEWDIYMFFEPGAEWTDRAPAPSRWVRQTALFPKGENGQLTSLLWADDHANAPVEGSLTEHLGRLLPRPGRAAR